jgi:methyl-accepting chemotaxis protein
VLLRRWRSARWPKPCAWPATSPPASWTAPPARSNDEVGRLLDAMQGMRGQLQAVMAAQAEMARRHDAGELSYRMDASAFPGEYGRMVADSNQLVASSNAVTQRLVE